MCVCVWTDNKHIKAYSDSIINMTPGYTDYSNHYYMKCKDYPIILGTYSSCKLKYVVVSRTYVEVFFLKTVSLINQIKTI